VERGFWGGMGIGGRCALSPYGSRDPDASRPCRNDGRRRPPLTVECQKRVHDDRWTTVGAQWHRAKRLAGSRWGPGGTAARARSTTGGGRGTLGPNWQDADTLVVAGRILCGRVDRQARAEETWVAWARWAEVAAAASMGRGSGRRGRFAVGSGGRAEKPRGSSIALAATNP